MSTTPTAFCGIDWARELHQVCLVLPGAKPLQRRFAHSAAGLAELVRWLRESTSGDPASLGVGLEVPHGPVVSALLAAGFSVYSINPKQLDRFRDRRSLAGAKDDQRDALTLARSLATDLDCFSLVEPDEDLTVLLRAASRRRETLLEDFRRFANRLTQALWESHPDLLRLCPAADEPWFWDVLEPLSRPTPPARWRYDWAVRLLASHRKRRLSAERLLLTLRIAPVASGAVLAALHADILAYVKQLRATQAALDLVNEELRALFHQSGELGAILDSQPGIDVVIASVFLAEGGSALRSADLKSLRTLCGTAPVTRRSGKSSTVSIRRARSARLINACRNWARTAIRDMPWAKLLYAGMRQRGLQYERALRGVADRLLERLCACIASRKPYDPQLAARKANSPLAA